MMHFISLISLLLLLQALSIVDGRPLRQATRADVIARYAQHRAAPSASLAPRASPSPVPAVAALNNDLVLKRNASDPECNDIAVSAVDFAVVCAPEDVLEPQDAVHYLMSNGTVLQNDGSFRRDPLFDTAATKPTSPLRSLVAAQSGANRQASKRRALPFFSRWAAKESRAEYDLLALSPNTGVRLSDLPEIALILLGRPQFEEVKIAGVPYDWKAMQALVDAITF